MNTLLPLESLYDMERGSDLLLPPDLAALYPDPLTDARTPDIILSPKPGTVYVAPVLISGAPMWTKIADHGSFYDDDVRVGLLVSNPRFATEVVDTPVETRQIACTILVALGLDCAKLDAQQVEPSTFLPHPGRTPDRRASRPYRLRERRA